MIRKIWQDEIEDLFTIQMVACSNVIWAQASSYSQNIMIDELLSKLEGFINGKVDEVLWENGKKGGVANFWSSYLSLKFFHKNKLGHVRAEVYMELDDGGEFSEHNCCFYVETELGLLEKFYKKLPLLKTPELDIEIVLNES